MQRRILTGAFFIMLWLTNVNFAVAQDLIFPSSPNPVGSGARAIGMGGAFIGVADDATAASWNPGGLPQLDYPEISIVGNWIHRREDNKFGANPEAEGVQPISEGNINYASLAYPLPLFENNKYIQDMVIALNYQHLYDFYREWNFPINSAENMSQDISYQQTGKLGAFGIAGAIKIVQQLYMGITFNFWDKSINRWKGNYHTLISETMDGDQYQSEYTENNKYSFSGFNFNIGMLWHTSDDKFKIGMVFKSPFTAEINHEQIHYENQEKSQERINCFSESWDAKMDMPMSSGIGFSYRCSDNFIVSADIYRTDWQKYLIKYSDGKEPPEGKLREASPINGKSPDDSKIDPTYQFRIGTEYVSINPKWLPFNALVTLRSGIFYDPAPSEPHPDNFYGLSLGLGITSGERLSFDIACEWRHGSNVNSSLIQDFEFSQNMDEYKVYFSLILYTFKK